MYFYVLLKIDKIDGIRNGLLAAAKLPQLYGHAFLLNFSSNFNFKWKFVFKKHLTKYETNNA